MTVVKTPIQIKPGANQSQTSVSSSYTSPYFNPKDISGLMAWYDVSSTESVTIPSSTSVSQLSDLSGNSNHLVQATTASQPTFNMYGGAAGLPYLSFSTGNNLLLSSFTLSQPYTVYLVIKQNIIVDEAYFLKFASGSTSNGICQKAAVAGTRYDALNMVSQSVFVPFKTTNYYKNDYALFSMAFNGANSNLTINNEPRLADSYNAYGLSLNPGASGITQIQLGSTANFNFHEALIFSGALTDTNDKRIRAYLTQKYQLNNYDHIQFFGDSITAGGTASSYFNSFPVLVSTEKNKNFYIHGVSGHTLNNLTTLSKRAFETNTGWVVMMYGTNALDITASKEIYRATVSKFIRAGYNPSKIVLVTPPYSNATTAYSVTLNPKVLEVSQEFNTSFVDVYTITLNAGGESLLANATHPNDAGHRVIADAIKAVIL